MDPPTQQHIPALEGMHTLGVKQSFSITSSEDNQTEGTPLTQSLELEQIFHSGLHQTKTACIHVEKAIKEFICLGYSCFTVLEQMLNSLFIFSSKTKRLPVYFYTQSWNKKHDPTHSLSSPTKGLFFLEWAAVIRTFLSEDLMNKRAMIVTSFSILRPEKAAQRVYFVPRETSFCSALLSSRLGDVRSVPSFLRNNSEIPGRKKVLHQHFLYLPTP